MNKTKLFIVALLAVAFFANFASAYSQSHSNWIAYNQYIEDRIPHNRMYDYFKYGSYWQGDVVYDLTYSYPPVSFPRAVAKPVTNYRNYYNYNNYQDYNSYNSNSYNYNNYQNYNSYGGSSYNYNSYNYDSSHQPTQYNLIKNNVHIHYHNPPVPNGLNTDVVVGCGYEDGYYVGCY